MDAVGTFLRGLFTYILYPIIVIGLFLSLLGVIAYIVLDVRGSSLARRITAALLPLIVLVFVISSNQGDQLNITQINPFIQLIAGSVIGVSLIETGRILGKSNNDITASVFILFLSLVDTFILYSTMQGVLGTLQLFLIGMIITAGLDIIFRGPPVFLLKGVNL